MHLGAAAGFALTLAALASEQAKQTLWIATDFGMLETGALYGPGLDQIGLATERLLVVRVARPIDALFAMEEALKCRALSTVVAELPGEADLTATRRLGSGGARGRRARGAAAPRERCAERRASRAGRSPPRRSVPDDFGGLGRTAFHSLAHKNRRGPCGHWTLTWDHHERIFSALSLGVAAAAADRPDRDALSA